MECPGEAGEADKAESSLPAPFGSENGLQDKKTAISPSQIINWKDFPEQNKNTNDSWSIRMTKSRNYVYPIERLTHLDSGRAN